MNQNLENSKACLVVLTLTPRDYPSSPRMMNSERKREDTDAICSWKHCWHKLVTKNLCRRCSLIDDIIRLNCSRAWFLSWEVSVTTISLTKPSCEFCVETTFAPSLTSVSISKKSLLQTEMIEIVYYTCESKIMIGFILQIFSWCSRLTFFVVKDSFSRSSSRLILVSFQLSLWLSLWFSLFFCFIAFLASHDLF